MFKKLPPAGTMKDFLKIEPGQKVLLVLRGEPVDFMNHFVQGSGGVRCAGPGCPACAQAEQTAAREGTKVNRPSFKFSINVALFENATWTAKVWENSQTVYRVLQGMQEDGYDMKQTSLIVTRNGTGKETTYTINASPKPPSPADLAIIAKLPMVDLSAPAAAADDLPF